jgi:hypothetical protein
MSDTITVNTSTTNITLSVFSQPNSINVSVIEPGAIWGSINGTLSAQADLISYIESTGAASPYGTTSVSGTNIIVPLNTNESFVAGGSGNNTSGLTNIFILGSNITAPLANYTYVNNLSSQGIVAANGGNSNNWNSAYGTVNSLSGNWQNTHGTVNSLSGRWESAYTYVNANSGIEADQEAVTTLVTSSSANWNTAYTTLSTLTYENVQANNVYETIQQYAASNPPNINKGSTVELTNGRVYIFAGTDVSNPAHYLEVNSNPISPVYAEALLYNNNQAIVDTFYVSDFKTAKYNLQIETNFNNEIYYSEINVVAAVGSAFATANEYGQVFTSELISGYDADFNVNRVHLVINFSSEPTDLNHKLIVKGQRTNYYKI